MEILIGRKLEKLRENKNLSIRDVSIAIEKSASTIKAYEADKLTPPINVLMKLISLYGASCDELFLQQDRKQKIYIDGFSREEADIIFEIDHLFIELLKKKRLK